ncbi:hypothetical protein CU098_007147 [Rhizopus stolonifer]|uniref:GABA-specific high-affinity permease n=1 Tax=Rhizopus stolonifer TaxID=4846 RepID=A0A367JAW0_RHIST|nr:hypothetical protein CU098_007147 [Rhizopus stolonifer]
MEESKIDTWQVEKAEIQSVGPSNLDYDAQRLHDLGYKQEFKREISLFVQAGFSFTTMAVLPNWLVNFGTSIGAGGPSSMFWGWIVVFPFVTCIALSMAEIVSAYPLAGGMYSWSFLLSSKQWGPFMAWINGYAYLIGLVTANITLAWTSAEFIFNVANVLNVKQIDSQGATIGLYCGIIIVATLYNLLGMKFSGYLNKFLVFWIGIGSIIVICTVPAMAPSHKSASWVFTEFTNTTGYKNNGLAFLLGLLQAGWTLVGYECGIQIVEGTKRADVTAPRGILICIASAIFQGFMLILSTLFSIQDMEELVGSSSPLVTFFLRATNSSLTAFFLIILLVTQFASLCNSILATSHIFWAMARDGCLPFSKYLYKLGSNDIPTRCLFLQLVISIIIMMPTFGSIVYWEAIMSASVICINVSYGIPFLCRLIWTRDSLPKGPFSLGRFSLAINTISVAWVCFFAVILCIPSVSPVAPDTMNWASVMIVGIMGFSIVFWVTNGRKYYKGPHHTTEE